MASIKGTARADYSIDTDSCSNAMPVAGATCTIAIVFDPSSGAARPARVELPADTARGLVVIALTGKGEKKKTSVSLRVSDTRVNLNRSVTVTAHLEVKDGSGWKGAVDSTPIVVNIVDGPAALTADLEAEKSLPP